MTPSLNRRFLPVIAFLLLATRIFADSADPVLATLGRTPIRESDFASFVTGMFAPGERAALKTNSAMRSEALEAFLDLTVLAAKARKDGFDKDVRFVKARQLMEMKLLARTMAERERERFERAGRVTEDELREYYDKHPERFQVQPHFTARQILVYVKGNPAFPEKGLDEAAAKERAQAALTQLRAGESWDKVAKEFSDDAYRVRGGLIEDGRFGYFPPEMETAVREQEIGKPGGVFRSPFGFHVVQVEKREPVVTRQPFSEVKALIQNDVANEKISAAHRAYMEPIRAAVKLKETPLAAKDTFVLGPPGIKPGDVLATLNGVSITQEDFEWFARDAFRMEQREQAFTRPGARVRMVQSFLNMKTLEVRARQLGIDKTPDYRAVCKVEEMKLLGEFLQERDGTTPWALPGSTDAAREAALKAYMKMLRAEMELKIL